ncbi:hypothetical protein AAW14_29785 [Streptomyces hygroscopicus]|uniref:heavy metal transporter n=1 Tax=Streptomyces hygroscopicus TaxID=1912 RepID=UPI0022408497|nr:heavy metal transporter [Streptomyces hygroscopicus]MCW7946074.1 hypothetical protein [Streptomyces hygroscopicus]
MWPAAIGVGLVLALVGYLAARCTRSAQAEQCTVNGADGTSVTLDVDQASHAATIAAVAHAHALPERAVTIALATALQESKLRNIDYGDRDSLGLFQQRPSQGWGTPSEVRDPVHASARFFDALVRVPDYLSLPLTEAAQKVQHSGYPSAYAQHESTAAALAAALTGREGPALTCTVHKVAAADSADHGGTAVTDAIRREFGPGLHGDPTSDTADLAYPVSDTTTGWALALWTVSHAATLHIASVTFENRRWNGAASDRGWSRGDGASGAPPEVDVTLARGTR